MKKSKAETAETRKRIVEAASKAFRSQGIEATGVAEIMSAAGLTHGGFYRHFSSKEQLVAEAIAMSPKDLVADSEAAAEEGVEAMLRVLQEYVTPQYRDATAEGCPLAAIGSELVRADGTTRHVATEGFLRIIRAWTPFMRAKTGEDPADVSISLLTNMIGALTIARMVDDPELSRRILEITKQRIASCVTAAKARARRRAPSIA